MQWIEWLKAALYGIVEGITEWLPVSSTGHLILLSEWLPFAFTPDRAFLEEFWEMFEVVIQLGAILAVIVVFWKRLIPFGKSKTEQDKKDTWALWGKVVIASIPAAVVGILGDYLLEKLSGRDIDGWLYNGMVVAIALIVYGIAFIVVEALHRGKLPRIDSVRDISPLTALFIGLFQVLSLIPGTSRSGSTILGSILLGISRTAAAEFSFFMAVPVMIGVSGIKAIGFARWVYEEQVAVPTDAWAVLGIGCAVSFVLSLLAIRFLIGFVRKHSFAPFGVYRILLGAGVLVWYLITSTTHHLNPDGL